MGWFDGLSIVGGGSSSHHHHHSSSSSKRHSSSPKRHSSGSIFGSGDHKHNSSRSSFFGLPNRSSSSYYKRSPRQGYLKRVYSKLRHLLRDLIRYMKKHPMKVFMLVIMPLITGGALTTLLAKFGIRLPVGVEKMFGAAAGGYGAGVGRGRNGEMQFERGGSGGGGMLDNLGGLAGVMGGAGSAINLAKMFM